MNIQTRLLRCEDYVSFIGANDTEETIRKKTHKKRYLCSKGRISESGKEFLQNRFFTPSFYERQENVNLILQRKIKTPAIPSIDYSDCGIMLIAFGYEYKKITPALIRSIRNFTELSIEVHTNIPAHLRSREWDSLTNIQFVEYDMNDNENRVIKTQLSKYSSFNRTLYIDVDSKVISLEFFELFDMLNDCDMIFPYWRTFTVEQLHYAAGRKDKINRFYRMFERFNMNEEIMVSGGICCFRKTDNVERFFQDYYELWKEERGQDMPSLNATLFQHRDKIKFRTVNKERYNNYNSSIIASLHSVNDKRIDFVRTRVNETTGQNEYIEQKTGRVIKKKRVAIFYDVPGWAFHHQALEMKKHLPQYEIILVEGGKNFKEDDYDVAIVLYLGALKKIKDHSKVIPALCSHMETNYDKVNGFDFVYTNDIQLFNKLTPEHTHYIPNGVDTTFFFDDKIRENIVIIGGVGSTWRSEHKGEKRIAEIADKSKLINGSLFVDAMVSPLPLTEVREYYKQIDVLMVSSYSETGPNPALEALSMGIPVIANPVGLIPEIIKHGKNGFIVNDWSAIDEYVYYLNKLKSDKDLYLQMQVNARQYIKEYDYANTVPLFADMIEKYFELKTTYV